MIKTKSKPCDFVIFGAMGDLCRRKLITSLYHLERVELIDAATRIIGVARRNETTESFIVKMRESLDQFLKWNFDEVVWQRLAARLTYVHIDMAKSEDYRKLCSVVDQQERVMTNYFAVPPDIFGNICTGLQSAGLVNAETRVVLEKPIGHDLASAQVINDEVARFFAEEQIYRIDHYLGKETVLNLLALRFANSIFTTNWDHNTIDHVQITVAEEVGIEGRWGYFDQAGQLRDMVQNHLLQILTLIAMEPPVNLESDSIRNEKLKVLKALRPITCDNVDEKTVRGQYSGGYMKGGAVPGYNDEDNAHTASPTETFVAIRVDIDNWRWADVPFYLRTGKRMPTKVSEVVINFKQLPHNIFRDSYKKLPPNKLIIRLQPHEGVEIMMLNKVPGIDESLKLQQTRLDLSFSEAFNIDRVADAYERLLLEAMRGNQALFIRRDEVEQAWTWVDSIQDAWQSLNEPPKAYPAGTWGPVAAVALLAKDGRDWEE
ncbi:MAG: glucose-6-phosphate dehydrogenase [Proteobacteria bacterium]|nr:glucose-6-phosphate dehydrogenase [Pseudomonadota bacterium]MBU4294766.1 glucose-6-phosphate dehydrogenase [Pseudomonadota bacterium]MCG2749812.1 glucose-6-phosphate dehydrogenase [Desulfobulbaceae bacterium]